MKQGSQLHRETMSALNIINKRRQKTMKKSKVLNTARKIMDGPDKILRAPIDCTKELRTRGGRKVVIIAYGLEYHRRSIIGYIQEKSGMYTDIRAWNTDGRVHFLNRPMDDDLKELDK